MKKFLFSVASVLLFLFLLPLPYFAFTEKNETYYYLVCEKKEVCEVSTFNCLFSGGAGYACKERGKNHLILSAYLSEEEARTVKDRLTETGKECYAVKAGYRRIAKNKVGKARLTESGIDVLYQTANGMDRGEIGAEQAKALVESTFRLLGETPCELREEASLYLSGEVRHAQIALLMKWKELGQLQIWQNL